jgi:hypothetical protein
MIAASNVADERQTAEQSRQDAARRFLAPELKRTIDRALYIHSRAIANFISASANNKTKPNDRKEDFLPYQPALYSHAPEVRHLSADDAATLSAFYDSLHHIVDFMRDWWGRDDQLPVNIFNMIMHHAENSLKLALVCIEGFDLDGRYPPILEAHGTLASRINRSMQMAAEAMKHHLARNQPHDMTPIPPRPQRPFSRRPSA